MAGAGLALGLLFGAVAQRTHFCTMGGVSDLVLFGSLRRLRIWALAIATALVGTGAATLAGFGPGTAGSAGDASWLGALGGGLLFGFGMVLAGGCLSRALVRLGTGSLKALLVVAVAGAAVVLVTAAGPAWLPLVDDVSGAGLPSSPTGLATGLLVLIPLIILLANRRFLADRGDVAAGTAVGALVAFGWIATTMLHAAEPTSLNFVQPATGAAAWLSTAGAAPLPSFALAVAGGTVLGAALAAWTAGGLRVETFASRDDLLRHLAGGAMMGAGGALAGGCTVGQGVAGVAALSPVAVLALAAILAGAAWGVKYLETGRLLPRPARRATTPTGG